jgi:hypothetical protein
MRFCWFEVDFSAQKPPVSPFKKGDRSYHTGNSANKAPEKIEPEIREGARQILNFTTIEDLPGPSIFWAVIKLGNNLNN